MASSTSAQGTASISSLPYTFNPPIHPSLQHVNPMAGTDAGASYQGVLDAIYDESRSVYGGDASFAGLRLGRIIMGRDALSFAMKQAGTRYGFRFLYNPQSLVGGTNVGTDFIADPSNTVTAVLQDGLESISLQVRLIRVPEVMGNPPLSDYHPTMTPKDMGQIRERGTHYDVEFLHRVSNGIHNTTVRSGTGDIGILLPNPCELYLGPFRSRGALMSVTTTDIMFSPDMVPMITDVSIVFSRFLSITNEGIAKDGTRTPTSTGVPVWRLETSKHMGGTFGSLFTGGIFGFLAGIGKDDSPSPAPGSGASPGGGSTPSGGSGWTLAPSLKKLGDDSKAKYSQVGVIGTYRNQQGSGHNKVGSGSESKGTTGSVHSIDIMINVSSQSMSLLNKLLFKCRSGDTRLAYLIHDRRIWSKNHGPWAERTYTGKGTAHTDHIHVSLNGDTTAIGIKNENDLSDWGI